MGDGLILYQDSILRFGKKPNNFGPIKNATIEINGDSPICGDHLTLYLDLTGDVINQAQFNSEACCAVCRASSSMMTDIITGKNIDEANVIKNMFVDMVNKQNINANTEKLLGELFVFRRIIEVPSRMECALLAWVTFDKALENIPLQNKKVV